MRSKLICGRLLSDKLLKVDRKDPEVITLGAPLGYVRGLVNRWRAWIKGLG